jgi:hypothetical protein
MPVCLLIHVYTLLQHGHMARLKWGDQCHPLHRESYAQAGHWGLGAWRVG